MAVYFSICVADGQMNHLCSDRRSHFIFFLLWYMPGYKQAHSCRDGARIQYGRTLCGVERAAGVLGIHANW